MGEGNLYKVTVNLRCNTWRELEFAARCMAQDTGLHLVGEVEGRIALLDIVVPTRHEACRLELKAWDWLEKWKFGDWFGPDRKTGAGSVGTTFIEEQAQHGQ